MRPNPPQRICWPISWAVAKADPLICHPTLRTFFKRYENVPASLADAALIRLVEINDSPLLLTTDSDFQIYRRY